MAGEYPKEYRESWPSTIEKHDARHEENLFAPNEISYRKPNPVRGSSRMITPSAVSTAR